MSMGAILTPYVKIHPIKRIHVPLFYSPPPKGGSKERVSGA